MGAASVIKYLLFFFNLLICLGGLVLLGVGIFVTVKVSGQEGSAWNAFTIAFIVIGATIFIMAFLGCCGAIRESHCMLTTFGILLSILFMVQVIGAILIFVFQNSLKTNVRTGLLKSLQLYGKEGDEGSTVFWDNIQKDFKCCGVDGPRDWPSSPPDSCKCKDNAGPCSATLYSDGCYHKFTNYVVSNAIIVAAVAIGLAIVELLGAIFSFRLASVIRQREHGF